MSDDTSPLLRAKAYDQPSVFEPANLLREGRRRPPSPPPWPGRVAALSASPPRPDSGTSYVRYTYL